MKYHVQRQGTRSAQHVLYPAFAADVGDLVRIRYQRRSVPCATAARANCAGEISELSR